MYNNGHSEDSRHVSILVLLNDLTWLELWRRRWRLLLLAIDTLDY